MSDKDRDYFGDVQYEAWRRGLPDISYDRISDAQWAGLTPDECVSREARRLEARREERRREEEEERRHYEQLECDRQQDEQEPY